MSLAENGRSKIEGIPQPSKAPDLQEVLVVWARTVDGRAAMATAPITLDGKERRGLGKWVFSTDMPGATVEEPLLKASSAGYLLGWLQSEKRPEEK